MPVTIKDVAALAGVSPFHRKPYLQGPSLYQPPDQGKGQAGHGKAGYEPNFQASSLATQNSRTVGIHSAPVGVEVTRIHSTWR